MSNSNFETLLKSEPLIHDLLNDQVVNLFSQYPDLPDHSPEFLEWISPKYLETFHIIFNECISKNTEGKLLAFLKAPKYCDTKTYNTVIDTLCENIEQRLIISEQFSNDLKSKAKTINQIYNEKGLTLINKVDVVIFNALDHHKILELKSKTIELTIKILQDLKSHTHQSTGMVIFNQNLENLNKLNLTDIEKNKFAHLKKAKQSFELDGKSLLSIAAVIIICIRIYIKLQDA